MPIYLLMPLRTDSSPEWTYSSWRRPVQVLAPTEARARTRANARYGLLSKDGPSPAPWLDGRLVQVQVMEEPDPHIPVLGVPESGVRGSGR